MHTRAWRAYKKDPARPACPKPSFKKHCINKSIYCSLANNQKLENVIKLAFSSFAHWVFHTSTYKDTYIRSFIGPCGPRDPATIIGQRDHSHSTGRSHYFFTVNTFFSLCAVTARFLRVSFSGVHLLFQSPVKASIPNPCGLAALFSFWRRKEDPYLRTAESQLEKSMA